MTTYLQLAGLFASLSLLSIGGGNAVLPEMHLQVVHGHHWMTDSQFADIFSISQTAPGPSILIVTLVGYGAGLRVGGVPGAILGGAIATVAMIVPAASLMYAVTLFWHKAQKSKWRIAVEKGFALSWWCGGAACEEKIKEETKATMRCIPIEQPGGEGKCILCNEPAREKAFFAKAY